MSATEALRFAYHRALLVIWGGGVAFFLYVALVAAGPNIEGRFFPVIDHYQMTEVKPDPKGGFTFVPRFVKDRNCTYHGITWFAPEVDGTLSRIQGRREDEANSPPQTGPIGQRVGIEQSLFPPEAAKEIFGIMHHDCGFIWQTRTMIGPFPLKDGIVDVAGMP